MRTYQPAMQFFGDKRTFWQRNVTTRGLDLSGENRIVIREYERHLTGSTITNESVGARPVYVDVLPLVSPTPAP